MKAQNRIFIITLPTVFLYAAALLLSPAYANALYIDLPPDPVTLQVAYPGSNCYYNVILSDVPSGYHVSNGVYTGWCVDEYHFIRNGEVYNATLYSSYDPDNPHPDDDWDMVNYILNHKRGSCGDVQEAVWYFVDGGNWPSDPDAQAMINDAKDNGEGFVPGPGQTLAVVAWIDDNTQVPILEVIVPPQNVVPQYPFGPIFGLVTFVAAFGLFKYKHTVRRVFKYTRL